MKAIVPVAGVGKRLRPHTYTHPKVLIRVAGKPILGHILDSLREFKIDELILIVGWLGKRVEDWVSSHYETPTHFIYQEERLGLGHAIYLARERLAGDSAWIIYGDTIFEGDISKGVDHTADGCIGVKEVEDPRRFGVVELGKGGEVTRLVEKPKQPKSNLSIVGLNFIRNTTLLFECLRSLIEGKVKRGGEYQLTDAFQLMVDRGGRLTTFPVEGWLDCGKPETLLETNRHLLEGTQAETDIPGSIILPPVWLAPTAVIENSVVGPYVSVADRAVIRNCVVTDTIVNENAVLENILLKDSLIGANAVVRGEFKKLNVGDSSQVDFAEGLSESL